MKLYLRGKTALVVAASFGLGYHCAHPLAAEGILKRYFIPTFGITADLTDEAQVQQLLAKTNGLLGKVDIVVLSTPPPDLSIFGGRSLFRSGFVTAEIC